MENFYFPLDGILVHRRVTQCIKFTGTRLYTREERGTVRVKCLAQGHNTMSPARARTSTARSGDEHSNNEATVPRSGVVSTGPNSLRKRQLDLWTVAGDLHVIMPRLLKPRQICVPTHVKQINFSQFVTFLVGR